ncbi:MAG TPA: uracil-DNA glycosylase [Jiangellaceae bacterium]|nr:uracil-DNA glycosylase [Jiangellaceae bacterium]
MGDYASAETGLPHPVVGGAFGSPVPPGSGWPEDSAGPGTPVAHSAYEVIDLAASAADLDEVNARSSVCRACPRLVAWREEVAAGKRRAFDAHPYWGRPVPGWGDGAPRILVVGLAPAAHGGNRTGRIFTGDRSGDWLFAAMHRAGLANQATSIHSGDGLALTGTRVVATVRCAPPANKPTPAERDACAHWLDREVALVLPSVRAVVALGSYAWAATFGTLRRNGAAVPRPRPRFGHGAEARIGGITVLGCFHPSQQNTFTGKLTEGMLEAVFARAKEHAGLA